MSIIHLDILSSASVQCSEN